MGVARTLYTLWTIAAPLGKTRCRGGAGRRQATASQGFNRPDYGRPPVGNGHDAAGFSAVFAPGAAAVDDGGVAGFFGAAFLAAGFLAAAVLAAAAVEAAD
ncbi:hypothetical protein G6F57_020696 [Rhizopus arrhizus]|nr:hypothetical protein G6F57_020696 [Rhizopus arrhizus]